MPEQPIRIGITPCRPRPEAPEMSMVARDGETWVALGSVDAMPPFFMNVVGASDTWLFAGSNGAMTAGRTNPDRAIFPYQTVDKILERDGASGVLTAMLVQRRDGWALWDPWRGAGMAYRIRRNLMKHGLGAGLCFEEINDDLGLRFEWELATCGRYGLVRRCCLENTSAEPMLVRLLDGWRHMIAPGVNEATYAALSYLAAGYMRHEHLPCPSAELAVYTLNAGIADRAEPLESLRAGIAWCVGLSPATTLLTTRQVDRFRWGDSVSGENEARGQSGALLLATEVRLDPGASRSWIFGADTWLDHAAVGSLHRSLEDPAGLAEDVARNIASDRAALRTLVGSADGLQLTGDTVSCVHHASNVVFNIMRGGVFRDGGRFPAADLVQFVRRRNRIVADRNASWLQELPETLTLGDLRMREEAAPADKQLGRLLAEYLPLTFSRRHGDPSRPWNRFSIRLFDDDGRSVRNYEGNWRDIFQNWEALALSFPDALDGMIAAFLNASTPDGYNPYRITRDGVDWEVADPGDAWGHFGYWGDHQIVYLLRLLEAHAQRRPDAMRHELRQERFTYANVPYRIAGLDALLSDPKHSITFDQRLHQHLMLESSRIGGDGKLLIGDDSQPVLASLAEKLLVPLLTKLTNLVPGGGIWLNTQRPEWNDANNALAGWGLSMVTVCYMRRYLVFLNDLLAAAGEEPLKMAPAVADLVRAVTEAIVSLPDAAVDDDTVRYSALRALGSAGEEYRSRVYGEGLPGRAAMRVSSARELIAAALPIVERTIRAGLRPDGLYHSYNVLKVTQGRAQVAHLAPMLEGQVAALSSGLLEPHEALAVCRALRTSDLYRPDQRSYMLYPDRELPSYMTRNTLPHDAGRRAPLLADLAAAGVGGIVVKDFEGAMRFHADLRNARDVAERLDALMSDPIWAGSVRRDREVILGMWEEVFRHAEFTGRSGTFFMFEGLGSIYWHMVAKLMLAVQECHQVAQDAGALPETVQGLADAYRDIREGLGYRKGPDVYGAFPTDPYSHSPRHAGAQQPGMTGQVKEEILTRWGELGVRVKEGTVRFEPRLLDASEFLEAPATFAYVDAFGVQATMELPAGGLGFTICGTPVCYMLDAEPGIVAEHSDGHTRRSASPRLTPEESRHVFSRTGRIARIDVTIPA